MFAADLSCQKIKSCALSAEHVVAQCGVYVKVNQSCQWRPVSAGQSQSTLYSCHVGMYIKINSAALENWSSRLRSTRPSSFTSLVVFVVVDWAADGKAVTETILWKQLDGSCSQHFWQQSWLHGTNTGDLTTSGGFGCFHWRPHYVVK